MSLPETVLLSTAYFPPVQYFSKLLLPYPVIEKYENYSKQSFRNRCVIYSANGPLTLVIPVVKDHGKKMPVTGVKIDYSENWQKIHLRSITSAYRSAPFFEFYFDEIEPFMIKKYTFLFDFNIEIIEKIKNCIGINTKISFTEKYTLNISEFSDFRDSIHPKPRLIKTDPFFNPVEYIQVFKERYGYIPNLSIIDLLFNEGPNTKNLLKASIKEEG